MDSRQELHKALAFHQRGDFVSAEKSYSQILRAAPRNFDANYLLGLVYLQTGKFEQARKQLDRAVKINPKAANALSDLGNALLELNRPEEALTHYDKAVALDPDFPEAFNNRGNALARLGRHEEAAASFDRAIATRPNYARAFYNRGNSFRALKRFDAAVASYDRAVAIEPNYAEAHNNRGNTLAGMGRPKEALAAYDAAIAINPLLASAFYNRAKALTALRRFGEALAACERGLALDNGLPEGWVARGDVLHNLKRYDDSLAAYDRAISLNAQMADAWFGRALVLRNLKRHEDAARSFEEVLRIDPGYSLAKGSLADEKLHICDWAGLADLKRSIDDDVHAGKKSVTPFTYLALSRSAEDLKRCAQILVGAEFQTPRDALCENVAHSHDKIRIGYMCGEFREHAVSMLMVELFELHNKDEFELFAFDIGFDDGSKERQRINAAFRHVVDISGLSDADAAQQIKQLEIDILVDLNVYSGAARPGILACRPAPVQVNYLAFPGTSGADYMDYIVADACVIPPDQEGCYVEKVVCLPDTYLCHDATRRVSERTPSRAEAQLPETGFVFCCFNSGYKIAQDVFSVWMRLLQAVEGSVLWLREDKPDAVRNLRNEAARLGIPPERLVLAPRADMPEHLARHRLADLFLDTLPYNAHSTAIDALWVGLPVLTCLGSTFPGRVGASLLHAVGMPELVASSLEDYEAQALRLARAPDELASLKAKLVRNRETCPLFDSQRHTRHLEAAYKTMWQRQQDGEPPAGFSVAPL